MVTLARVPQGVTNTVYHNATVVYKAARSAGDRSPAPAAVGPPPAWNRATSRDICDCSCAMASGSWSCTARNSVANGVPENSSVPVGYCSTPRLISRLDGREPLAAWELLHDALVTPERLFDRDPVPAEDLGLLVGTDAQAECGRPGSVQRHLVGVVELGRGDERSHERERAVVGDRVAELVLEHRADRRTPPLEVLERLDLPLPLGERDVVGEQRRDLRVADRAPQVGLGEPADLGAVRADLGLRPPVEAELLAEVVLRVGRLVLRGLAEAGDDLRERLLLRERGLDEPHQGHRELVVDEELAEHRADVRRIVVGEWGRRRPHRGQRREVLVLVPGRVLRWRLLGRRRAERGVGLEPGDGRLELAVLFRGRP